MADTATASSNEKLWSLIRQIRVAMLTTETDDGSLRSRPMMTLQADGASLWFYTSRSAPKGEEIEDHHAVNLSFADPQSQLYVSVSGRARLVDDRTKIRALWNDYAKLFFPQGADDPDLTLLEVMVEGAEYWDSSQAAMRKLESQGPGAMSPDELGENRKV